MVNPKPGHCKFCGEPITNKKGQVNKRATWHPACALTWTIMNNPSEARRFVFLRDRGLCRDCGKDCHPIGDDAKRALAERIMTKGAHAPGEVREPLGQWEVDHIIPLYEAARRGSHPQYWQLGNLQSLCHECHAKKTAEDKLLYGDLCPTAKSKTAPTRVAPPARPSVKNTTIGSDEPELQTRALGRSARSHLGRGRGGLLKKG